MKSTKLEIHYTKGTDVNVNKPYLFLSKYS